ncbi:MAG TPA: pseudouridine synthase [Syntrophorhabdaceae bacterium]|nr:pseudouridine synthase [Syntrophorhabdaceae bacterium]HPU29534.1 pseudouridine synthase [Syntrophorhabdaceae bacterium]
MRLSKFISDCGIASRRKSEELIKSGRVKVNNNIILEPFFNIDYKKDIVTIDDIRIKQSKKHLYIALYKPVKYISDLKDDKGRNLARDLIDIDGKLFPVGRLDYNSEGLILFTDDGEFANKIMHPKYGIEKEYLVKVKGALEKGDLIKLKKGIVIDGSFCKVEKISFLKAAQKNNWYVFIVKQGKNRMIRKMCLAIKHPVLKLIRVRIGNINIGNLIPGQYRFLTEKEVNSIKSINI